MKKLILAAFFSFLSMFSYAQKTDTLKNSIQKSAEAIGHGGNNELKINLLYTVIGMPEISYERLLADNMGAGASLFIGVDKDMKYQFAFFPYYRIYFGAKKASGFFIEGNAAMLRTSKDYYNFYSDFGSYPGSNDANANKTHLGLGASAGAKFLTRNGFLGEVYFGAGRLFNGSSNYSENDVYPRVGITVGKRF